jgi:hypothetical protein
MNEIIYKLSRVRGGTYFKSWLDQLSAVSSQQTALYDKTSNIRTCLIRGSKIA